MVAFDWRDFGHVRQNVTYRENDSDLQPNALFLH